MIWIIRLLIFTRKLIESLQLKLIEKEQEKLTNQIECMVDATSDTNDILQKVDATCDTHNLIKMVGIDAIKYMVDDFLSDYRMESFINSELMKTNFIEYESQVEDFKAQNDTKSIISQCKI